jgi:hypothetical protein
MTTEQEQELKESSLARERERISNKNSYLYSNVQLKPILLYCQTCNLPCSVPDEMLL